ncbi:MAG TPA: crosslink repair DNA glycosylase YcaQ family protein [Acidimicrobiia bacterium]|nr:crosslink repair DNA glycosylase YcaQ family protein [Acidimicrobiia bacterium]
MKLTLAQARRIAITAQGLADPRPRGRVDARHIRRVLGRIGLLQIDSVNVLARAHYIPLFSRLGPYPMGLLDDYAYGRRHLFEYWGHVASMIPIEQWPLFVYRMEAFREERDHGRLQRERPGLLESVLEEVAARGPVTAAELDGAERARGTWWDWSDTKRALESQFITGRLSVADRVNFVRRYDLTERVIPPEVLAQEPLPKDEAHRRLLLIAARAHGVGTAADLSDYHRIPLVQARRHLAGLAATGLLTEVSVEGWTEPAYLDPEIPLRRRVQARALLVPFDPLIWFRPRTERLFWFHYRIEIYVPEPQRKFGYYVLPFLLGEQLVARVDLKADRAGGALLVRAAHIEEGADRNVVTAALADELGDMARWLGLEEVEVHRRGNLSATLGRAIA